MYDVAIVGAGPAGSTLARLIGRRYRVLLVDRHRLDAPFVPGTLGKPCGGLLAPAAQRELARQGLGVPADVISGPRSSAFARLTSNWNEAVCTSGSTSTSTAKRLTGGSCRSYRPTSSGPSVGRCSI